MSGYLHIVCLPYHLLVDARHVREVLESEVTDARNIHGCCLWHDNSVRVLDLRITLGETAPPLPHGGLVFAESETDGIMLLCDKVLGFVQVDDSDFSNLPHSIGQIANLVDAVVPDATTGQLLFHLKMARFFAATSG